MTRAKYIPFRNVVGNSAIRIPAGPPRPNAPHARNLLLPFCQALGREGVNTQINLQHVHPWLTTNAKERIIRRFGHFTANNLFAYPAFLGDARNLQLGVSKTNMR